MKNTPRLMPLGLAVITSALAMAPINGWAIANWARKYNVDCATCHSPAGDLKGVGAKYDPVALQGRMVYPRRGGIPGSPSYEDRNAVKATITAWLQEQQVPHLVPPPLPSEQYGDASHPLAAGYAALARQLLKEPAFR